MSEDKIKSVSIQVYNNGWKVYVETRGAKYDYGDEYKAMWVFNTKEELIQFIGEKL